VHRDRLAAIRDRLAAIRAPRSGNRRANRVGSGQ